MAASLEAMRSELSDALAGAAPGRPAADELCAACLGLFGMDGAAVSVIYDGASWGTFGASGDLGRRLDEYQFTYGEGPCLDAVSARAPVLVPDLDSPHEQRWPAFADAVLADGIRGVFALPIMVTSVCVGALDLFRVQRGTLEGTQLRGALLAAQLVSTPLLELITEGSVRAHAADRDDAGVSDPETREARWDVTEMNRIEVYQATGVLISQLDVDATEALVRLRAHAIATDQTASQVARAIIDGELVLERDEKAGSDRPGPQGEDLR